MMTKLDWYILKKFLTTFIFCMILLTALAVAVDSSEKTDDFVKTGLSSYDIFTKYYLGFIPWIWGLMFPLFVFIAVIFFTSKMALRSEVIAILASGTTFNRWLRPYLVGGVLCSSVLWLANRYVIPKGNEIRGNFQSVYFDRDNPGKAINTSYYYFRVDANTYIGIKYYDTGSKSSNGFFLEKVRNNKMYYNLRAERLQWNVEKKTWNIINVTERKIDSLKETIQQHARMTINLNLKPEDLRKDEYLKDKLTTPELKEYIRLEELRGVEGLNTLKIELYRRTATPATALLLTIIGAVIACRKTRGGSGLHLAIGIMIAAIFIISDRFSTVFSLKGNLPPLLAVWIPNIVFTFVAWYLYRRAPK